jgi:hypothetical protein
VGTDARKLVADGYPLDQVVISDLRKGAPFLPLIGSSTKRPLCLLLYLFWLLAEYASLGHKLFKTTQETYPLAFVPGDVFDPNHLEITSPLATAQAPPEDRPSPDLLSLTSLNPLHGRVFAIHASAIFHLFGEEKQLQLARALAGLLSPEPGSIICGVQRAAPEKKGFELSIVGKGHRMWFHSPESWTELWDGLVFEKGVVKVQTELTQVDWKKLQPDAPKDETITFMLWSVIRL